MRRLFFALAVGILASSNAGANFTFDSVTNSPGGGFSFNYDWGGVTVGLPRYGSVPPSGDFIGQVMDGVKGVAPNSPGIINHDPTHFTVQLVQDYGNTFDVFVQTTNVAYTTGTLEPLFSIIDNYNGTAYLPEYYDVVGVSHGITGVIEGPSGAGTYSPVVPEPSSIILMGAGIGMALLGRRKLTRRDRAGTIPPSRHQSPEENPRCSST